MKIFISWSGETSRALAQTLRLWLPSILQYAEPYVSSEDIGKGARWSDEIGRRLEETAFGIICVTRENVGSPWLNFEAGALSKSVELGRVSPFLFGISTTDLVGPLAQFQATLPKFDDVAQLIGSINDLSDQRINNSRLNEAMEMWWPRLDEKLQELSKQEALNVRAPQRDLREIVEEILEITRGLQRRSILDRIRWRKSSYSGNLDAIEVGVVDDSIALRTSRDPSGPMLVFTQLEWDEFIRGVRNQEPKTEQE